MYWRRQTTSFQQLLYLAATSDLPCNNKKGKMNKMFEKQKKQI